MRPMGVAGLATAFKMTDMDGATPTAARARATKAYPHARCIVAELHNNGDELAISQELERATGTLYGSWGDDPHREPQLALMAGFHVGFAVCWLLMMGAGGAR